MSQALRLSAVAEGVETPEQLQLLRERGCTALQGFLFSRPLRAEAVMAFIAEWERRGTAATAPERTCA
jgi:EAL domain-containing protein (putative c-di-GMP-specific phosphodiesterase class I)